MKQIMGTLLILAGVVGVSSPLAAGDGYLNSKGQLSQALQVKQLQGGFAGDTGWFYKIEKDGAWRKYSVFNRRLKIKNQGTLDANQLKKLAANLAKYKLLQLPPKSGKVSVNRQLLTIQFGKRTSQYIFGAGKLLPKANPATVPGRFGGIIQSVMQMTKSKKAK